MGRVRFVISPVAIINLIALLSFFITPGVQDAYLLRIVRLFRIFSLAKLGRYSTALRNVVDTFWTRRYELLVSLVAAFVVMLVAASVLYVTESQANPKDFGSIPRALWWGVATVTEVGYAGAFPVTVIGKMFAGLIAIAAVAVVALPVGILAAGFGDVIQRDERTQGRE